jgi:hypothetical protein
MQKDIKDCPIMFPWTYKQNGEGSVMFTAT